MAVRITEHRCLLFTVGASPGRVFQRQNPGPLQRFQGQICAHRKVREALS